MYRLKRCKTRTVTTTQSQLNRYASDPKTSRPTSLTLTSKERKGLSTSLKMPLNSDCVRHPLPSNH